MSTARIACRLLYDGPRGFNRGIEHSIEQPIAPTVPVLSMRPSGERGP